MAATLLQQASPCALGLQRAAEPWRWSRCAQCGASKSVSKAKLKSVMRRSTALGLGLGLLLSAGSGWAVGGPVQSPRQSRRTEPVIDDDPVLVNKELDDFRSWIRDCFNVRNGHNLSTPEGLLCLGIKAAGQSEVSSDGLQVVFQCTGKNMSGQDEGTPGGSAASPQDVDRPEEETTGDFKKPLFEEDIGNAIRALQEGKVPAGLQDPSSTSDFWKGVVEETQLIEWPTFPKVLGTTGVVVAMILGSSVVLLTVNALLSQLSDTIFKNI